MPVDSGLECVRANLQDMVISYLRHAPRVIESITVPPSGRPRSCWKRSTFHFVSVNVISAWEKWGPICHPLVLAGDLMRVFERRAVYALVQNSGPPLLNLLLGDVCWTILREPLSALADLFGQVRVRNVFHSKLLKRGRESSRLRYRSAGPSIASRRRAPSYRPCGCHWCWFSQAPCDSRL